MSKEIKTDLIDNMFKAGAHFGYSKTRRHPSVSPFIFTTKNKVDVIDLEKTDSMLAAAKEFVKNLAKDGKKILFVGVKPEAKKAVKEAAIALDMPYVTERWIGGTFTNFPEIKKRIAKLEDWEDKKSKGELDVYTKKERLMIGIEVAKLNKYFSGLVSMKKAPDAIFVIDTKQEMIAVVEAQKSGIPVIGISNSDSNIKGIDYPIVANDASSSSISLFVNEIVKAYKEGQMMASSENK